MKRFLALCMIFLLLLAGCSGKKEQEKTYVQEREGLWVSEDGGYVCIFANGCVLAFDERELREGMWLMDGGSIAAEFTSGAEKGEQWAYSVKESSVHYEYDAENGKLLADGKAEYAPAVAEADFRAAAEHIGIYEDAGNSAWMSQVEMNMGAGVVSDLWIGLESLLLTHLTQTAEDPDGLQAEEAAWEQEKEAEIDAVREEYAGGSIAGLMVASTNSRLTEERFEALLAQIPE